MTPYLSYPEAGKYNGVENEGENDEGRETSNGKGQTKKLKNIEGGQAEGSYNILKEDLKRDDCSVYGEHVANEIRKLNPKSQTIVKHLINNVLFEAAMENYDDADDSPKYVGLRTFQPSTTSSSNLHLLTTSFRSPRN